MCAVVLGANSGVSPTRQSSTLHITDYLEDEFLLRRTARDAQARIRVYRPERTSVVLGRGSDPEVELHLDVCLADEVPVHRRRGGGCAVVLDPGNVIVSFVLPAPGLNHTRRRFDSLSEWLLDRIHAVGYPGVYRDGTFDFVLDGRKVGGACVYRTWNLMLFTATILLAPDLEAVDRYLRHPPREPAYRRGRRHHEFLGRLPVLGGDRDVGHFAARLEDSLAVDDLPLPTDEPAYQTRKG